MYVIIRIQRKKGIDKKMRVIYKAIDGQEFDNELDCINHESEVAEFRMFDQDGETISTFSAKAIYLPTPFSVVAFEKRCEKEHTTTRGINGPGCYFWYGPETKYLRFFSNDVKSIAFLRECCVER